MAMLKPRFSVTKYTLVTAALLCVAFPTLCIAQVQLPAVNLGLTNFEDAYGAPGWILQEFPDAYIADEFKDSQGKAGPDGSGVTAYSTTSYVAFISKKRVLGGWLAGEILQPIVDLDVQLPNGPSSRIRGLADLTLGVGLQWAPKKTMGGIFVHRVVLDVGLPTGKYSDRQAVNIGNHFVVVDPYYALTYQRSRVEFSARLHYLWNSTNNDPFVGFGVQRMQPGQAFHINYATSYQVWKNVRVGFNGYWLEQLTDHSIDGSDVHNSKERTVGLGPGIQLGAGTVWFRVNGYVEAGVRNRPSGNRVTFRITKFLPAHQD